MTKHAEHPQDLPADVARRKDVTWQSLATELVESRTRRRRRRAGVALFLGVAAIAFFTPHVRHTEEAKPPAPTSLAIESAQPEHRIEIVERPTMRILLESIDDDTLLSELTDAGFERSLIRIGSDVRVAFSPKRSALQPGAGG